MISVGDRIPEFSLKDQNNQIISSRDLAGKRYLLSFHPLAWTGICEKQMKAIEENRSAFESLKTVPLGLSIDSVPSKKAWAEVIKINWLQLLSDFWPHGGFASKLGMFREKEGFSQRANIVVDNKGVVELVKLYEVSQLPDIKEILDFLRD